MQKRSLVLVLILQSLAAAEIANALHLRDFRSSATFEFFNTIRHKRSVHAKSIFESKLLLNPPRCGAACKMRLAIKPHGSEDIRTACIIG